MMNHRHSVRTSAAALLALCVLASHAMATQGGPSAPAEPAKPAAPKAPAAPAAPGAPALPRASAPAAPAFKSLPVEGTSPTAKDVFARHLDAIGGAAALESKSSMSSTGSIELPAVKLKGSLKMSAMKPDLVIVETELPGIGATAQGFDGTVGWSIDPMRGPSLMGDKEVAQVRRDGDFRRDLVLANDPGTSKVLGLVEFEGTPCWQVSIDVPTGTPVSQLYAKDTGLMRGMAMSASTPMGELPIVLVMDEYLDFGGVRMATRSTTKVMGQVQVMTIDSVEWNAVPASAFEPPAPIRALKDAKAKQAQSAPAAAPPAAAPQAPPAAR